MELKVDSDVQMIAEYMQANVPANKLMAVAEQLPQIARLLWSRFPQEPCIAIALLGHSLTSDSQLNASEYVPDMSSVDGGSVVEADTPSPQ